MAARNAQFHTSVDPDPFQDPVSPRELVAREVDLDAEELAATAHASPARKLQLGLSQWAEGAQATSVAPEKLPPAQSIAIIFGASAVLWAIIAAIAMSVPSPIW